MPIIITDERLRIPARERFKTESPYDVRFFALTIVALIVLTTSMILPAFQDFQTFHEFLYNVDSTARFDLGQEGEILPSFTPNKWFKTLSNIITTANSTCIHNENYFQHSFINTTMNQLYDIEDVYFLVENKSKKNDENKQTNDEKVNQTNKLTLPPTFSYSCSPSNSIKSTQIIPNTVANIVLDDIVSNLVVLHSSHTLVNKEKEFAKQHKSIKSTQKQAKDQTSTPNPSVESIKLQRREVPKKLALVEELNLTVVCHHRLFCGYFNTWLTWGSIKSYLYLEYLSDLAQNCIVHSKDVLSQQELSQEKQKVVKSLPKEYHNSLLHIFSWSLFTTSPILYPLKLMINAIKAFCTITFYFFTEREMVLKMIEKTEVKTNLIDLLISLRQFNYTTRSFRIDTIFDTLVTLYSTLLPYGTR